MVVQVDVPNNLRNSKFNEAVATVVDSVARGEIAILRNSGEYAVSTTEVVEGAKRSLLDQGIKVYQANNLEYSEVYAPQNERTPLAKPKIHHYQIKFSVKLSAKPIEDLQDHESQQIMEPKHKKSSKS